MATLDEVKRKKIWQNEGIVITCDRHIIGFSNIEKIYDIREKIQCGKQNCTKDGQYEIELQF